MCGATTWFYTCSLHKYVALTLRCISIGTTFQAATGYHPVFPCQSEKILNSKNIWRAIQRGAEAMYFTRPLDGAKATDITIEEVTGNEYARGTRMNGDFLRSCESPVCVCTAMWHWSNRNV